MSFLEQFMVFLCGSAFMFLWTRRAAFKKNGEESAFMAFSSLLSSTPNFTVITGPDNKVRYISKQIPKFAGISRWELAVGRPFLDLFHDKTLKLKFAGILGADRFIETVMEIDTGGGGQYFKVVADKLSDEAGGMFIDISDITPSVESRKAAEKAKARAEEANSAKSRFLANMSHDLRTPLYVIMGMNEMIGRAAPLGANEDIADWSAEIACTARSLLSLVDSVLDVSNVEQGRHEINASEYAVADLVRDLAVIGEQEARTRGLNFIVNAAHETHKIDKNKNKKLPSKLYGDFERVRRIAANLISNAAKYTERGTITLEISFEAEKSELRISVSDTGIGIKEEDIGWIFEKFKRVKNTKPGSGLGLMIALELARLMGGDITVSSVWGEGSVFTAAIPQRVADPSPMLWRKTERKERAYVYSDSFVAPECRVLVVDDSLPNLNVTRLLLARTRMEVDTASSGAECVEILAAGRRYNALIMDYMMPGMNGVETLLRIKEKIPGFAAPAIMCTADAITNSRIFSEAGFVTCLTKPVAPAALECALLSVLPEELVTRIDSVNKKSCASEKIKVKYTTLLAPFGVDFDEAMKYAKDVDMFVEQARVFVEGYEKSKDRIEAAVASEDWELARSRCHSLRGLVGYVGAFSLGETALKIHAACRARDTTHVRVLLPVLQFEWKRARDGLEAFALQHKTCKKRSLPDV